MMNGVAGSYPLFPCLLEGGIAWWKRMALGIYSKTPSLIVIPTFCLFLMSPFIFNFWDLIHFAKLFLKII